MICQSCGKCMPLKDTFIFKFKGTLLKINVTCICCEDCSISEMIDLYDKFPYYYIDKHIRCYKAIND